MDKAKVMISGCNGHMGQIVCRLINESEDMTVLCGFDIVTTVSTFPVFSNIIELEKSGLTPDIIIDFSKPDGTMEVSQFAFDHKIPFVIATTGLSELQSLLIEESSKETLVFISSNMSYLVTLFEQILREIAPKIKPLGYDIEIVETHHNRKADSPSGTAQTLAKAINSSLGNKMNTIYGREGKRESNEIGIASLRGGDIVGIHTVKFISDSDVFELTHTALSRDMFAKGALTAARYMLELKEKGITHGLFGMKNMI